MNLFAHFHRVVIAEIEALMRLGILPARLDPSRVSVEPPRDAAHGDLATNAAMVLAKSAGMTPRELAEKLAERLRARPEVVAAEIAGPGFLNLRLADAVWHAQLGEILLAGPSYGDSQIGGGRLVNVEYVSANPTGPMHVGHGRGAVFGDALAALLEKAGFAVTREYYINDAGAQVDILARSLHLRYREALGEDIGAMPEGFYPADYLKETGKALAAHDGGKWRDLPEDAWLPALRDYAVAEMLAMIRGDLEALGVKHAVFASEREIVATGAIERALRTLEKAGLIYVGTLEPPKGMLPDDWEARPQTLFRSTSFGDDVDRPLKKSDGSWTYFAADIAYHLDKYERGFSDMIDVWGADHGGYVKRVQAAVKALTGGSGRLDVKLCQLVNLFERGVPVRMSKRAGTFVTLREAVDEVGKDVFRFVMLTRRNDQALDFDFAKAVEQSKDNPVYYVQYAHARASSVLRRARESVSADALTQEALAAAPLARLTDPDELALIRLLANWPRLVESAAEAHEPHRIAFYLQELAAAFHGLTAKVRYIVSDDPEITLARLALVQGVAFVVASGLKVFGVEPVAEMRSGRGEDGMARGLQLDPEDYPLDHAEDRDGDPGSPRGSKSGLPRGLIIAVGVIGGAGALWAGAGALRHRADGPATIPIIRADDRPVKVLPVNAGGMEVPDQDMLVLNKATPVDSHSEQLLPPPETPLPRPVPNVPPVTDAAPAQPPADAASAPVQVASAAPVPPAPVAQAAPPPAPPAATPAPVAKAVASGKGYRLQVGAVRASDVAHQEWDRLRHAQPDLLGKLTADITATDLGERGVYYRIIAGPIADGAEAERVCAALKQRKVGCILVKP